MEEIENTSLSTHFIPPEWGIEYGSFPEWQNASICFCKTVIVIESMYTFKYMFEAKPGLFIILSLQMFSGLKIFIYYELS